MIEGLIAALVLITLVLLGQVLLSREGTTISVAHAAAFGVGSYAVIAGRAHRVTRVSTTTITLEGIRQ